MDEEKYLSEKTFDMHLKRLGNYFGYGDNFKKKKQYRPNVRMISLEITTDCSLHCFNCNRSCSQAPSSENMSVAQIAKFVKESISLNWRWERILIMGGEPTLHPNFFEILKVLGVYNKYNPACIISLETNGFDLRTKKILQKIPKFIRINNTDKRTPKQKYLSYNIAPIDLPEYENSKFESGCSTAQRCGLGMIRYGYYGCGSGASVDRVFGFDIGIKKLEDLNDDNVFKQFKILCKYCGIYKINSLPIPDKENIKTWEDSLITTQQTSPSWKKAYDQYKKKKPKLSLYK